MHIVPSETYSFGYVLNKLNMYNVLCGALAIAGESSSLAVHLPAGPEDVCVATIGTDD